MSQSEIQLWALVVGLLVFGLIVGALFARRRLVERKLGQPAGRPTDDLGRVLATPPPAEAAPEPAARADRRRPAAPAPTGSSGELASAIRSLTLRAVAERAPAGWSALVLCPPPHAELMTWHVHLAPAVALDLQDGRTVTVAAPLPSHEWRLAGGRVVGVGEGEPEPAPTDETVALRVTGPYLVVTVSRAGGGPELTARVMTADGEELPQTRAITIEQRAVQAALREAVEQAVGSRMLGVSPAVRYTPSSWAGHERVWLTIGG